MREGLANLHSSPEVKREEVEAPDGLHSCGCVQEPKPPPSVAGLRHPAEAACQVAVCSLPGLWQEKALTTPRLSGTGCISSVVKTSLPIHGFENAAGE